MIADYEEQGGHVYQPHNGDGASASSAGTASPDIFQSEMHNVPYPNSKDVHGYQPDNTHDIVVTSKDLSHGKAVSKLVVCSFLHRILRFDQTFCIDIGFKPVAPI